MTEQRRFTSRLGPALEAHIAQTGKPVGTCVVYPFHKSYPEMPDLFHVRCAQHPDFGFCGEKDAAEAEARAHTMTHGSGEQEQSNGRW